MYTLFIKIMSNPIIIGFSIYIIMLLLQSLISISAIRSNLDFLIENHDYDVKELRTLFVMSVLLTPISTFIWLKSIIYRKSIIEK